MASDNPSEDHLRDEQSRDRVKGPRRRFIRPDVTPEQAMIWSNSREKSSQLDLWRDAVGKAFAKSARVLRVAWALEWLFKDGFAYPTDSYLSRKLDMPVNKVQAALKALEDGGAIYRASTYIRRDQLQRRIWPSREIVRRIHPDAEGVLTPRRRRQTNPHRGETEYSGNKRTSKTGLTYTLRAARIDAERRENRAAAADSARREEEA
jgi:hypothetical protein